MSAAVEFVFIYMMLSIFANITMAYFEYGAHENCDKKTFRYVGQLPASQLIYRLNITHDNKEYEKDYTYLIVKYNMGITKLDIQYDKSTHTMTFKKRYPLREVDIEVVGYALPVNKNTNQTKC